MTEFRKAHRLIQVIIPLPEEKTRKEFVDLPGYLYHEEIYEQDLFVHHRIIFDKRQRHYRMLPSWVVSEPRTGLSIDTRGVYKTRRDAVSMTVARIIQIPREQFHESILLGLAAAPERTPRWRFISHKSDPVRVER